MAIYFNIIYFLIFSMLTNQVVASKQKYYINSKSLDLIKNDLPSHKNLLAYLNSLNRIIDFLNKDKDVLTVNLVFGLFLINVNLEPFLNEYALPLFIRSRLDRLLTHSSNLQDYYNYKSKRGDNYEMKKILAILCSNATAWSRRLTKMNVDLLNKPYSYVHYPEWSRYKRIVEEDIDKGTPNPKTSDKCVKSLAESEENRSIVNPLRCEIPKECYKAIAFGTNSGYWLTHRLIILLQARLSLGCTIFSVHDDELLRTSFCEMAYVEAKYNALYGFQIVDLVLEQIALCALDGHAQFLRRTWLTSFLEYQNPNGCFQLSKVDPEQSNSTDVCNDHAMAVAAGTYAAAVRFILENY